MAEEKIKKLLISGIILLFFIGCATPNERLTKSAYTIYDFNYEKAARALKDGANPNINLDYSTAYYKDNKTPILSIYIKENERMSRLLIDYGANTRPYILRMSLELLEYSLYNAHDLSFTINKISKEDRERNKEYLLGTLSKKHIQERPDISTLIFKHLHKNKEIKHIDAANYIISLFSRELKRELTDYVIKNDLPVIFVKTKTGETIESRFEKEGINFKSEVELAINNMSQENRQKTLFFVVTSDYAETHLEFLKNKGVDFNKKNDSGTSLLVHVAAHSKINQNQKVKIVKYLLENNFHIESDMFPYLSDLGFEDKIQAKAKDSAFNFFNANFEEGRNTESDQKKLYEALEKNNQHIPYVCLNANTRAKVRAPMKLDKKTVELIIKENLAENINENEVLNCAINLLRDSGDYSEIILPHIFKKIYSGVFSEQLLEFAINFDKNYCDDHFFSDSWENWNLNLIHVVEKLIRKKVFPIEYAEAVFIKMTEDRNVKEELYNILKSLGSHVAVEYEKEQKEKKEIKEKELKIAEKIKEIEKEMIEVVREIESLKKTPIPGNKTSILLDLFSSVGTFWEAEAVSNINFTEKEMKIFNECTRKGGSITKENVLACPLSDVRKKQIFKAMEESKKLKKENDKNMDEFNKKRNELIKNIDNKMNQLFKLKDKACKIGHPESCSYLKNECERGIKDACKYVSE